MNMRKQAEEEVEKRRRQSRTYTEPLPLEAPNVKLFLDTFYERDIFENGLKFKDELNKYSDSVGEHYKFLVPEQVSFDEFFSRYYYRCKIENILDEWQTNESPMLNLIGVSRNGEKLPENSLRSVAQSPIPDARRSTRLPQYYKSQSARFPTTNTPAREMFSIRSNFFAKVKEKQMSNDGREARNVMALKLLEEAKGKPEQHSKSFLSGIQLRF